MHILYIQVVASVPSCAALRSLQIDMTQPCCSLNEISTIFEPFQDHWTSKIMARNPFLLGVSATAILALYFLLAAPLCFGADSEGTTIFKSFMREFCEQ